MILVTLGTQDKSFVRLIKMVEECISKNIIKESVIVQAGHTKYESNILEIIDYVDSDKFKSLIKEANYIITHGGVGSILGAIREEKKVIAVARLKKYHEHTNDHQEQVIHELASAGYIMSATNDLEEVIKQIDDFKPRKYHFGNEKMINIITDFITSEKK